MNICGCLIFVQPNRMVELRRTFDAIEGVEVHAETDDGRFIVVVEDTPTHMASETIMDLHQIPGVISLTLTYHNFEEEGARHLRPSQPAAGDQVQDHF